MIQALKNLFEHSPQESEESKERSLRLAAAALMVETARADFTETSIEGCCKMNWINILS